ncbi:hypothetical protein [Thalassococcus lentus]|uniref:SARP family transcriptional regulator n=1 Tax=Thalassococcus lentus TaxID=1210524 RepID=A0ABT4XUJ6_9RHOB|nr:hypothetical protein [Thalassococcus lentus]MDA7425644.1 hypothetical protein [Thalassococcus lentus]
MSVHSAFVEKAVTIHLCGTFRMVNAAGKDVTPRGAKTCGLVALLATAHLHRKTRIWLQDKLWSDRGREQGAASLRQALASLRRILGDNRDALNASRTHVSLDASFIHVVDNPQDGEFLEGIDIRDEEFEEWLTLERSKRDPQGPIPTPVLGVREQDNPAPLRALFVGSGTENEVLAAVELSILDHLSCTLRENLIADVVCQTDPTHEPGEQPAIACDVRVSLKAFSLGHEIIGLRVLAEDGKSGTLIWSDTQQSFLDGMLPTDNVGLLRIGNQMLDALSMHFSRRVQQPEMAASGMLLQLALRNLFSMTRKGSIEADRLLQIAQETSPKNGLVAATRAHVRAIQWVERYGIDEEQLRREAQVFQQSALDLEPGNSAVLANLANTTLILDRDFYRSEELSDRAIAINPGNPFAWWVRSASELYLNEFDKAHSSAKQASALLGPGPLKFWWDQHKGLTTAIVGSVQDAIRDLRRTHATAPTFRPALRFLIALYGLSDDEENAAEMIRRLQALESDFTSQRLVEDETYPAKLARSEAFMNDRSRDLLLGL